VTERETSLSRLEARRRFIQRAAAGSVVAVLGGAYILSDDLTRAARAETRGDGRPRVPPGQRVLSRLKPMGGEPSSTPPSAYRLRVYGEAEAPFELTLAELAKLGSEHSVDVHCVTGWSVLGARFKGVALRALAERARVKPSARHVIFEAAHGYTANVRLNEALRPNVLVATELDGQALARAHGGPLRAVVPDLYFWKSAKWLEAVRFVSKDEPGYWETRGYNNHGDPWREERYS
jgi:DMSO/TMAO reductase YedYZ molybdopterin-dependent catalytic subunit